MGVVARAVGLIANGVRFGGPWWDALPAGPSPVRERRAIGLAILLVATFVVACSQQPFTLDASGPFAYPATVDAPFERVAIIVTIANRTGDDLAVNPADFVARDANRRVYPANSNAAIADAHAVRLAHGIQNISPLPTITLRHDDALSGFVVFDVPAGVRPVEVIWRQSDTDYVVNFTTAAR